MRVRHLGADQVREASALHSGKHSLTHATFQTQCTQIFSMFERRFLPMMTSNPTDKIEFLSASRPVHSSNESLALPCALPRQNGESLGRPFSR